MRTNFVRVNTKPILEKAVPADNTKNSLEANHSEDKYISDVLNKVILAAQQQEILTVEFIKNIHKDLLTPIFPEEHKSTPSTLVDKLIPGEFRRCNIGCKFSDIKVTEEGIEEIFDIMRLESKDDFPVLHGTWIGPKNKEADTLSHLESVHYFNLDDLEKNCKEKKLSRQFYHDAKERCYIILFPRTNKNTLSIDQYMHLTLQKYIDQFNLAIKSAVTKVNKIELIVSFIQSCLRLYPFRDANHRVFGICVLNFLLAREGIGRCFLSDIRQFILVSKDQCINVIKKCITPLSKKHLPQQEFQSILNNYMSTSCLSGSCLFSPIRSKSMRELQKLSTQKIILKEEIEKALNRDSTRRANLFTDADFKVNNTSTDAVIKQLRLALQ